MENSEKILMKGNEAIAEAAIRAGCTNYYAYPITPQNEIPAYMAKEMPKHNRVFLQAESEVAAINMVIGAASTGERTMTSSSSVGVALKQEGLSYLAGMEIPAVLVSVMRGGPGLGNIAGSQGDYFQATKGGGNGDYKSIVLTGDTVQELTDLVALAFDLADKYKIVVTLLFDGYIGQVSEGIVLPKMNETYKNVEKPWSLQKSKKEKKVIYSMRLDGKDGTSQQERLSEHNHKLQQKYKEIEKSEVRYKEYELDDAEVAVIAYGTPGRICKNIVKELRSEGKKVGYFSPITLYPFPTDQIASLVDRGVKKIVVIEMNAGQMLFDVKLAVMGRVPIHFYGETGGVVPLEKRIREEIEL